MAKKYISKINIRPSSKTQPIFIPAGTEFEERLIDKDSLTQMIKSGTITEVKGAKAPATPPPPDTLPVEPPAPPATVPQGIWKYKRKGIEKLSIDVLNALYKETADEAGLVVTPIEDKEEILKILCSENGEKA